MIKLIDSEGKRLSVYVSGVKLRNPTIVHLLADYHSITVQEAKKMLMDATIDNPVVFEGKSYWTA